MSFAKTIAALAALCFSSVIFAAQSADSLTITSIASATESSLAKVAQGHLCKAETIEKGRVFYYGACFNFPGEVSSEFDFTPEGRLIKSTICLRDNTYLAVLWGSLSKLFGHPQAMGGTHGAFTWAVGEEIWTFIPSTGERWFFTRERCPEAKLKEIRDRLKFLELL